MSGSKQSLRLLTVNVNGLRGLGKIARLFGFIQGAGGNPDVVLLQELHLSCEEDLRAAMQSGRGPGMPYYGLSYFSGGTDHSSGVAILVRMGGLLDDDLPASAVHRDAAGRWVRIDCTLLRQPLSIFCAYAPNEGRTVFFSGLHDHVPASGRVIMGGDFNCVCDPVRDQHPPSQTHTTRGDGAQALSWLVSQRQLVDAYRHTQPEGTETTHTATHARHLPDEQQSRARLDRWYVSQDCAAWVKEVRHLPCSVGPAGGAGTTGRMGAVGAAGGGVAPGDHAAVLLVLAPPGLPTIGPGQASFPTHLLYDQAYLQELQAWTAAYFQGHAAPAAAQPGARFGWWCQFKLALLTRGQALHRRWRHEERGALWAAAASPSQAQGAGPAGQAGPAPAGTPPVPAAGAAAGGTPPAAPLPVPGHPGAGPSAGGAQQYQPGTHGPGAAALAQPGPARLVDDCTDRMAMAQAILHNESGERCTAYHFSQAGAGKRASIVAELRAGDGQVLDMSTVSSGADLLHVTHSHYSSASPTGLFKVGTPDIAAQDELLAGLPRKLNAQQQREAEGPKHDGSITLACLTTALGVSEWGKAPGPDGLQYEVYKMLWLWVGPALAQALGDLFAHGAPGPQWGQGLITLIYKKGGKPRDSLASYRPITLMNCDNKLAGRVLTDRMQMPLDYLIDPAQTAFIRGRQITDNIFNRQTIIDYLEAATGASGCLLFLDIAKAYDRVDRAWLMRCADAFGLPAGMRKWMLLTMDGTTARVNINSWHSPPFPVDNGLPQGGPPCPCFWVLQLEPLTAALRRAFDAGHFTTPTLPGGIKAPPVSHHADDTGLCCHSLRTDYPTAWSIVRKWQRASNADMADEKQGGLMYGPDRVEGRDAVTGMYFWQEGEPRPVSLGLPCTSDHAAAADAAYDRKLGAVAGLASIWGRVPQSMAGRALTAQQLLASQATYLLPCLPPVTQACDHLGTHQRAIHQYVARSSAAADRTLNHGSTLSLLPAPRVAALPRSLGGLGVPDLGSQYASLAAKMVVHALAPGPQAWKAVLQHLLAAAAPHPNWGMTWIVTHLPLSHCGDLGERVSAAVHMYRMLLPVPFTPTHPQALPKRALLLMPLFYTELLRDADGAPFTPPTGPLPPDWPFTVAQLAGCSAVTLGTPTLQSVVAALPTAWALALTAARSGDVDGWAEDEWWVGRHPGTQQLYVRKDRGGEGLPARFALALHSGLLYWLSAQAEASPVTLWSPACVLQGFKRRSEWSPVERARVAAAAGQPGGWEAARPVQHRLLGPWADVRVYPDAWALGGLPLSQYAAKNARVSITQLAAGAAVASYMPEYAPGRAVRPRLWPRPAGGAAAGNGSSPSGLDALERQWVDVQRGRPMADWAAACEQELRRLGMELGAEARQRRAPLDRAAAGPSGSGTSGGGGGGGAAGPSGTAQPGRARAQQPQQRPSALMRPGTLLARLAKDVADERARQAARPEVQAAGAGANAGPPHATNDKHAKYFCVLWDEVPVNHDVKCFALRLLHASLPCRAMHAFMQKITRDRRDGRAFAECRCCSGRDQQNHRVFETYTHLFLRCPTYAGASGWLMDLWEEISGARPPDTGAALVADEPGAWPAGMQPTGDRLLLWQALRLTLLFHIWEARCSDDAAQHSSRAVVAATISSIRSEVQLQYHRTYHRQALLRALPIEVFARQQQRPPPATLDVWLCPGIATLSPAGVVSPLAGQPPPPQTLHLHLSLVHPVPAPAALPAAQAAGVASS